MLLTAITIDPDVQPRAALNADVVETYAGDMDRGCEFPPVVVFNDGATIWLADGFHRVAAAKAARLTHINADERRGTKRDAIWFAVGCNAGGSLVRSNADKRKAVEMVLRDEMWALEYSDRVIAERCGVHHSFVAKMRPQVATVATSNPTPIPAEETHEPAPAPQPAKRKGKDGKMYPAKRKAEPESESEPSAVRLTHRDDTAKTSPELDERVATLLAEGLTPKEAARKLGVAQSAVYSSRRKQGLAPRRNPLEKATAFAHEIADYCTYQQDGVSAAWELASPEEREEFIGSLGEAIASLKRFKKGLNNDAP